MPFFEGAQHFVITSAEMNDVGGDYNKTETTTSVTNSDVGNRYMGSVVSKGNTETQTAAIRGNNNLISVHGQHRVNGNIQLSDLPQLQNALQALPGIALSGIPGAPATTAIQSALQSLSVDSTSSNGTSTSTGTKPLLAGSTSPNPTSTSTVTGPPSVGGPSSDGTDVTAVPATRVAGPPAAPLVDDSLPKESSPPRVETALVVPTQAGNTVGSVKFETDALKANEKLQTPPVPVAGQAKQRKSILATLVSIFGGCFNFRT
ncbi:hypothetical protein APHAL10511_002885 [Amanita phalloides]|nr:hypothetical protein APHAL10511_002885 [Amanita phalloides]